MKKTHYELLEVAETCSDEMVRLAHGHVSKALMEKFVAGDLRARDDLWAVNAAYEVLSDPPHRRIYDEKLKQALSNDGEAKSSTPCVEPDKTVLRDVSTIKLILGVTGSSMVMLGFF